MDKSRGVIRSVGTDYLPLVAVVLLAPACFPTYPPLQPRASEALACPPGQVKTETAFPEKSKDVQIVTGCGKTDIFLSDNTSWVSLRERAAFELQCPAAQIAVTLISRDTYGVTGCSQNAVYKFAGSYGFVLDSASVSKEASKGSETVPADPTK